jgi:hypothetical protein
MAKKKELPVVSVLERRLANPFGAPSVPITLKDGGRWAIRIANDGVRTGRVHQIIQLGWTYVTPDEIDGRPADFGFREMDGRLVRGEHGQEVIVKMPQADFDAIQSAKADKNLANLGGKKIKHDVANATAAKYGDEAGETVFNSQMDVQDSRVSVDLDGDTPS